MFGNRVPEYVQNSEKWVRSRVQEAEGQGREGRKMLKLPRRCFRKKTGMDSNKATLILSS